MNNFRGTPIINDSTDNDFLFPKAHARGYVERDYSQYPEEMFAPPSELKLIPRSEWDARIDEQEELQSSLEHIRMTAANGQMMPSLDQNGQGYCWAYSIGGVLMLARARDNQPYVRLSPHAVACKIKGFRDEGGWCGLSAKFARETGYPSEEFWPQKSMNRANDNAATWENAKLHRSTEEWVDLTRQVYDQNLTFDQMATCLLLNIPVALDFSHWAHSVTGIRFMRIERGSYGPKILNSWTDAWGDRGMSIMQGSKGIPNGAVAIRTVTASAA